METRLMESASMESRPMEDWQKLVDEVLELEWEMFTNVQNEGSRASCQDDRYTFQIMRSSQFAVWNQPALESWKQDLLGAKAADANLMTEKYGYMMEDTAPEAFEKIRELLPELSGEKRKLVEELTGWQVQWREMAEVLYPEFGQQGRVLRKEDARCGETSLETYAKGELSTYSVGTLQLLKAHFQELVAAGVNPGLEILRETMRQYGREL